MEPGDMHSHVPIEEQTVIDLAALIADLKMHLDYERERRKQAEAVIDEQNKAIAALKDALAERGGDS